MRADIHDGPEHHTRSNQRPDTLMQDRICQVDETSCNARPDHTFGSKALAWASTDDFRFNSIFGHVVAPRKMSRRGQRRTSHRAASLVSAPPAIKGSERSRRR